VLPEVERVVLVILVVYCVLVGNLAYNDEYLVLIAVRMCFTNSLVRFVDFNCVHKLLPSCITVRTCGAWLKLFLSHIVGRSAIVEQDYCLYVVCACLLLQM
jgi:hypothetical protein